GLMSRGISISTDHGQTWKAAGGDLPGINALAVGGGIIFAATAWDAVYRSANEGRSWQPVHTGLCVPNAHFANYALSLAVIGTKVLVGTGSGIFVTGNQGESWEQANQGLPSRLPVVRSLFVSGTKIFAATYGGIFVSTDQGQSWKPTGQGAPQTSSYAPLALSGKNLFLGHFGSGVFRSSNEGSSWVAVNTGLKQTSSR